MTEIKIPLSKTKIILFMLGALAFVIGGAWGVLEPERFASIGYPKNIVFISGLAGVLFFGLCFVFIARKVFSGKAGLTINDDGIIDNSNATSVGLIEWKDITGVKSWGTGSAKVIVILTSEPEKYIERSKNIISKKAMKANNRIYGSPLSIISNSLKINFSELEKLILEQIDKRKK
ncbi:STM3941 family protein [uncultured Tenacibaculum sp.]|uniref:STM3941 family protein n=1 Tax=uncultured Tenacibaculum sp. TaxID=174713 RepID=UPI0026392518|nr:STM3941 family protein [uncultured Tenacibaculum sp.]